MEDTVLYTCVGFSDLKKKNKIESGLFFRCIRCVLRSADEQDPLLFEAYLYQLDFQSRLGLNCSTLDYEDSYDDISGPSLLGNTFEGTGVIEASFGFTSICGTRRGGNQLTETVRALISV